jgi:hypothetical protein
MTGGSSVNLGKPWEWAVIGILALIGLLAVVGAIIYGLWWLCHHVSIS